MRLRALHVRDPSGTYRDPIDRIAAASSTPALRVTPSVVTRVLLGESLDARREACADGHVGVLRDGTCGNCGGAT